MPTVEQHFRTLSEAEGFCDDKIDAAWAFAEEEGRWVLFHFEHKPEERTFSLLFNDPHHESVVATYDINDC